MALPRDAWQHFKSETVRGCPGFFRVGQTVAGQWWLIGPDGLPLFARAVNRVHGTNDSPNDPIARLRKLGFNALGSGTAVALREEGLPFIPTVGFASAGTIIHSDGIKLPDVFEPNWRAGAERRASEVCSPLAENHNVLGWLTDDELSWGGAKEKPSLLQVCLSLEPSFAAYHAAWEFVLAPHGGQLARLAKAWSCTLESKGVVREITRAENVLCSPGHDRDDARWTREFAQRYFHSTSAAIRAHAPNHLIFGAAYGPPPSRSHGVPAWFSESVFPLVDVAWIRPADMKASSLGPVFVGSFCWVEEPYLAAGQSASRARGATSVERMLRHGRSSLRSTIAQPSVVGYAWKSWRDDPAEQPPFGTGLVHLNDVEAREHTELLADLNGRTTALRPFAITFGS